MLELFQLLPFFISHVVEWLAHPIFTEKLLHLILLFLEVQLSAAKHVLEASLTDVVTHQSSQPLLFDSLLLSFCCSLFFCQVLLHCDLVCFDCENCLRLLERVIGLSIFDFLFLLQVLKQFLDL